MRAAGGGSPAIVQPAQTDADAWSRRMLALMPGTGQHGLMDEVRIRMADPAGDAAGVAAVYADAIDTAATFELVPPGPAEMRERMRGVLALTPWLVAVDRSSKVLGYAYAGRHKERAGYRWSVDISAYVAAGHRGQGLGRRLYDALLPILGRQGFVNVYAGITLPNPASQALHAAIGMQRIGVYPAIGYKNGAWHDVAWYGLRLGDPGEPPREPIALPDLRP